MASARAHPPKPSQQMLDVWLGATLVGTLTHLGNEDNIFAFDAAYIDDARSRPTLSLGFKSADGGLVHTLRSTHVRLAPFFSNLLPEAHLRDYLASRGKVHPQREFFLIWLLGADLPGAIEIRSPDGATVPDAAEGAPRVAREGGPLRFSLAGVQLKFSAIHETRKGLTIPANGTGGDWIVKLPSMRFPAVPENEYAMMTLARHVGIDVPDVRLVPTGDIENVPDLPEAFGQSFVIHRFDRPAQGQRVHIEDFAQVFSVYPEQKYGQASYGNIARVLWLETGEAGVLEFIRRLVFNVLIGNADAHLKNWSLIYPDGRTPKLAPAYDLVSTIAYIHGDALGLSLAGTKAFAEIDLGRFEAMAQKAGLPVRLVTQTVRDTAARVRESIKTHEPVRALPERVQAALADHMKTVPL